MNKIVPLSGYSVTEEILTDSQTSIAAAEIAMDIQSRSRSCAIDLVALIDRSSSKINTPSANFLIHQISSKP
jgi:hypothetical protein